MAEELTIRKLMESGVHFGHRSSRWNPKMKPYIFMKRNLVHIIDLRQTLRSIIVARRFLSELTAKGGQVLFVGTKRQARNVILNQARRSNMHYVTERWLGGTLTNFSVIRNRLKRLEYLEELEKSERLKYYSKKMQSSIFRTKAKMLRNLEGIRKMTRTPDAIVIVDPSREKNALREARKLNIPSIAILDTDCDPDPVDVPIPANDDAMRSIAVLMEVLGDAVVDGVEKFKVHVGPVPERPGAGRPEARPVRRRGGGREGRGGARPAGRGPGRGVVRPGKPPVAKERPEAGAGAPAKAPEAKADAAPAAPEAKADAAPAAPEVKAPAAPEAKADAAPAAPEAKADAAPAAPEAKAEPAPAEKDAKADPAGGSEPANG
jgi:small subunit ribosomal protein S2